MTLPLPLRNRLAEVILEAFHDADARETLRLLAATGEGIVEPGALPRSFPGDWFERRGGRLAIKGAWRPHAAALQERARRARTALAARPLEPAEPSLAAALAEARVLWAGRLYFEVHERLESSWLRAEGSDRRALQGLIQAAVGCQHLANGNLAGARALLAEGAGRLRGQRLEGVDLDVFARGLRDVLDRVGTAGEAARGTFDWAAVPAFPF